MLSKAEKSLVKNLKNALKNPEQKAQVLLQIQDLVEKLKAARENEECAYHAS